MINKVNNIIFKITYRFKYKVNKLLLVYVSAHVMKTYS